MSLPEPKRIEIADPWRPEISASVAVYPIGAFNFTLDGRADITIRYGLASMTINPNEADLGALIEALQWARDAQEVTA